MSTEKTVRKKIIADYWRDKTLHATPHEQILHWMLPYSGVLADQKYKIEFSPEVEKSVNVLCNDSKPLIFAFYLSTLYVLLHRYSSQNAITVSSPSMAFLELDQNGHSPVFFHAAINIDDTFKSVYAKIKDEVLNVYKHQAISWDEMREIAHYEPGLFDHIQFRMANHTQPDDAGLTPKLALELSQQNGRLILEARLGETEYRAAIISNFLVNYKTLLEDIIQDPQKKIGEFKVISELELNIIKSMGTGERTRFDDESLFSQFEKRCSEYPDRVCLVESDNAVTYRHLYYKAAQLSSFIDTHFTANEFETVGLLADRSLDMVIGTLALIRSGRTYVPLDPSIPKDRLLYILDDTQAKLVLADPRHLDVCDVLQWESQSFESYICITPPSTDDSHFVSHDSAVKSVMDHYIEEEGFNDATESGWVSSYTGQEFSKEEISEMVANVRLKLGADVTSNAKVLEIGCGSGLILFSLAPLVAHYHAIDISEVIVKKVQEKVRRSDLRNVQLDVVSAIDIYGPLFESDTYDIIIVNSAMTHFPSYQYLREFLLRGVKLLKQGGIFFLGDVRDKRRQMDFYKSLLTFKAQVGDDFFLENIEGSKDSNNRRYYETLYQSNEDVRQALLDAKSKETHFFIDANFFIDFFNTNFNGSEITVEDKIGDIKNELKRFRFDVVVKINKNSPSGSQNNSFKKQYFKIGDNPIAETSPHKTGANIILYTSGSSGRPKGVLINEKNLNSLIQNEARKLNGQSENVWPLVQSTSFDVSLWELYGSLLNGSKLVVVPLSVCIDPKSFTKMLIKEKISVMTHVPAMFKTILPEMLDAASHLKLKYIVLGGEVLSRSIIEYLAKKIPDLQVINAYGMTECSVISLLNWNTNDESGIISIGKPIANTNVLILDDHENFVPVGVFGQLYICGPGVSAGYLNSEELTQKKFIWHSPSISRLYKTGDIGRWLPNGTVEFKGRKDFQVKIRGYRVEPEEIRQTLLSHKKIKDAIVVVDPNTLNNETELVAYYILNEEDPRGAADSKKLSQAALKITPHDAELLEALNNTDQDLDLTRTVVRRFEEQVKLNRDKISVVCNDQHLTYDCLNNKAEDIAVYLSSHHAVTAEDIIAVVLDRSLQLIETILAIWKSRAAYIPIDPKYPTLRIAELLQSSQPKLVISTTEYFHTHQAFTPCRREILVSLDEIRLERSKQSITKTFTGNELAYVIYTSGSTGQPKGVMIEQKGMLNHIQAKITEMNITPKSIVAQNASQCFDISVWQAFSALVAGGKTIIYTEDVVNDVANFISCIDRDGITLLEIVPTFLTEMMDVVEGDQSKSVFQKMEKLIANAETLKPNLAARWFKSFPNITLINTYGATEVSDDTSHYFMNELPDTSTIPICLKPIQNFKVYLLNEHMERCAVLQEGEIYLSGPFVGRGYLNDVEKTQGVFLDDPFRTTNTVRMYKTGDFGKYQKDGTLEFIGRKDYQVKVNGHRIEIGEIEHHLTRIEHVKDAVVVDCVNSFNETYLHAFIIHSSTLSKEDIRSLAAEKIPPYMVPSQVTFVDSYPLNQNGKVDRNVLRNQNSASDNSDTHEVFRQYLLTKLHSHMIPSSFIPLKRFPLNRHNKVDFAALPSPTKLAHKRRSTSQSAQDITERELQNVWKTVLALEEIDIDDNFFELGGHSLKAAKLISHVHKNLNVKLELGSIFMNPTLRQQAVLIRNKKTNIFLKIPRLPYQEHYAVSNAQKRLLISCFGSGGAVAFNMQVSYELTGLLDLTALQHAFSELIRRHEILRTTFLNDKGEFRQRVHDFQEDGFKMTLLDWSNRSVSLEEIDRIRDEQRNETFDLENGPLIRVALLKLRGDVHLLIFSTHHIVADGWSGEILINELSILYAALREGTKPEIKPILVHYKDFAAWQLSLLSNNALIHQLQYWKNQFGGATPVQLLHPLPISTSKTYDSQALNFLIDSELGNQLINLCHSRGVSVFVFLQAVTKILLYYISKQQDLIVGAPVSGRNHADLDGQVGFYLNPVALRNRISETAPFSAWLLQVNKTFLDALNHQDYPFDLLIEHLHLNIPGFKGLFNVWIDYHDFEGMAQGPARNTGLQIKELNLSEINGGKYDLDFLYTKIENTFRLTLWYNSHLFNKIWASKKILLLDLIIKKAAAKPDVTISEIVSALESQVKAEESEFKSGRIAKLLEK